MKAQQQMDYRIAANNDPENDGPLALTPTEPQTGSAAVPRIVVIGCSGHARVVVDIIEEENRCRVVGLLDSFKPAGIEVLGYQVLGSEEDLPALITADVCDGAIVAIGDNWIRSCVVERVRKLVPEIRFVTAIHPSARIARNVRIGGGTVVMAGAVVNTGCRIGDFCILNTSCSLDHDSTMGAFSSLAPRAVTGGGVRIGEFSAIAIGAIVSHESRVGEHTVIGAGATVLNDVPARVVAYGTPVRIIRERNPGDPYLGERSKQPSNLPRESQLPRFVRASQSLKLLPPASAEWPSYLERTPHDFFHTAEYHELTQATGSGNAWLAVYGNPSKFVAWPYLVRDLDDRASASEFHDVNSVYGYAGPLTCGCEHDEAFLNSAWRSIVDAWRSQSVVSVFTRFHPLLANHCWLDCRKNAPEIDGLTGDPYSQGKTVAIILSGSQEEIWNSYKRQLRQGIRRLLSFDGILTVPDAEWKYLDRFVHLYYSTMKRNGAAPFYFFPKQHFRLLKEALGPHGSLLLTRYQDEIIAAALLIEYGGIVSVHLLATDPRFAHMSPSKLIIHAAQGWAHARGNRFLHLGGGRGSRDDDPLFRFKALFSNVFFPFYTGRWILDRETYDELTIERQKCSASLTPRQTVETYFPAYRAPFLQLANPGEKGSNSSGPGEKTQV